MAIITHKIYDDKEFVWCPVYARWVPVRQILNKKDISCLTAGDKDCPWLRRKTCHRIECGCKE